MTTHNALNSIHPLVLKSGLSFINKTECTGTGKTNSCKKILYKITNLLKKDSVKSQCYRYNLNQYNNGASSLTVEKDQTAILHLHHI